MTIEQAHVTLYIVAMLIGGFLAYRQGRKDGELEALKRLWGKGKKNEPRA